MHYPSNACGLSLVPLVFESAIAVAFPRIAFLGIRFAIIASATMTINLPRPFGHSAAQQAG